MSNREGCRAAYIDFLDRHNLIHDEVVKLAAGQKINGRLVGKTNVLEYIKKRDQSLAVRFPVLIKVDPITFVNALKYKGVKEHVPAARQRNHPNKHTPNGGQQQQWQNNSSNYTTMYPNQPNLNETRAPSTMHDPSFAQNTGDPRGGMTPPPVSSSSSWGNGGALQAQATSAFPNQQPTFQFQQGAPGQQQQQYVAPGQFVAQGFTQPNHTQGWGAHSSVNPGFNVRNQHEQPKQGQPWSYPQQPSAPTSMSTPTAYLQQQVQGNYPNNQSPHVPFTFMNNFAQNAYSNPSAAHQAPQVPPPSTASVAQNPQVQGSNSNNQPPAQDSVMSEEPKKKRKRHRIGGTGDQGDWAPKTALSTLMNILQPFRKKELSQAVMSRLAKESCDNVNTDDFKNLQNKKEVLDKLKSEKPGAWRDMTEKSTVQRVMALMASRGDVDQHPITVKETTSMVKTSETSLEECKKELPSLRNANNLKRAILDLKIEEINENIQLLEDQKHGYEEEKSKVELERIAISETESDMTLVSSLIAAILDVMQSRGTDNLKESTLDTFKRLPWPAALKVVFNSEVDEEDSVSASTKATEYTAGTTETGKKSTVTLERLFSELLSPDCTVVQCRIPLQPSAPAAPKTFGPKNFDSPRFTPPSFVDTSLAVPVDGDEDLTVNTDQGREPNADARNPLPQRRTGPAPSSSASVPATSRLESIPEAAQESERANVNAQSKSKPVVDSLLSGPDDASESQHSKNSATKIHPGSSEPFVVHRESFPPSGR